MKIELKYYSSIKSLLSSILFLIIGALMFTNPNAVVIIVSYVLGGIIIILGLYECIKNYVQVKRNSETTSKDMILGITAIIIGLVFIFLAEVIETIIRFIIGAWILFSGINRLIITIDSKIKDKNFWIQLTISLLLIIGGVYTILKANLAFQTIGLILIVYAVIEIIGYIFNQKGLKEYTNKEEKESENSDIKEAKVIEDKTLNVKSEVKKKPKSKKKK